MTNYHLFDFLDFPEDLNTKASLWKSYRPTVIEVVDGDIRITTPFQKQKLAADMAADEQAKQVFYKVVLRQYNDKILRMYCDFSVGSEDGKKAVSLPSDESEMLLFSENISKIPLNFECQDPSTLQTFVVNTPDGKVRAIINLTDPPLDRWSNLQPDAQQTLDIRLFPDGKHEVRLAAYEHFSQPR